MKVKMLEELVSRIDGKPASGAPLFLGGGGEGGGRLTWLSWDPPHPCCAFCWATWGCWGRSHSRALYEGDIIRVQRRPFTGSNERVLEAGSPHSY